MTDNTQVASGAGDTVRDIDRSLNAVAISAKTQVVQLDAGGQSGESLVSGNNPLPVNDPFGRVGNTLLQNTMLSIQSAGNGFIPIETPAFLVG